MQCESCEQIFTGGYMSQQATVSSGTFGINNLLLKWIVSFIIPAAVYFMLPIDGKTMTHEMGMFLAITFWMVIIWAFELVNEIATGIALPVLYVTFCDVPTNIIYQGWFSDVPSTVIGGFILCKILQSTGLGKRIGLACMRAMNGSFTGVIWGLAAAIYIVSPFIPTANGKSLIFCAIVISLCESLDIKKQSREATALMMAAFLAVTSSKLGYLTGGGDLVIGMNLVNGVTGESVTWLEYAWWNLLPATIYTVMSVGIVVLLLPSKMSRQELISALEVRYAELGEMTRQEKVASIFLIFTLGMLVTDKLHGMQPGMALCLVACASFLPKVELMNGEKIKTVNFGPLFFIMGCMAIGSAGNYLKVTQWMADGTFGYFEGLGEFSAGIAAYIVGVVGNFILTPLAATASFSAPLAELALNIGVEPKIVYFSFIYGFDNIIFPYETAPLLLFYGFGYIHFGQMVKILSVRILLVVPFLLIVAIPWWKFVF